MPKDVPLPITMLYSQAANTAWVLDHGFVRLVAHMGSDRTLTRNNRAFGNPSWISDSSIQTSPLENVVFTFEVKAPIFVLRQWPTLAYNEIDSSYTQLPDECYTPSAQNITCLSEDGKKTIPHPKADIIREVMLTQARQAHEVYKTLIKKGCPKELARSVLPVNTYSHTIATVNLRNLFGFLRLGLHPKAPHESKVYAEAVLAIIDPLLPIAVGEFKKSLNQKENQNG